MKTCVEYTNSNNQIKLKTNMLESRLWYYSNAYILIQGTITAGREGTNEAAVFTDREDKKLIFGICALCTD